MALSSLGMLASSVCAWALCRAFGLATHEVPWRLHAYRILPVGLFMAIMFYFGNLCYLYISLSFIQMLKTGSPIITMAALALSGLERPSARLVAAVVFIALGTAVTSVGELHFSWLGFVYMLLSQVADAVRLVMTQVLLTSLQFHPLEGLMHLSPACTLCLWVGMCVLELPAMRANDALGLVRAKPGLYAASALMGFLVNVSSFMVIKYTSSLTLKILGAISNAVLVFGSCAVFGDEISSLEVGGYTVSLGGFIAYNLIKLGACGQDEPLCPAGVGGSGGLLAGRHHAGGGSSVRSSVRSPRRLAHAQAEGLSLWGTSITQQLGTLATGLGLAPKSTALLKRERSELMLETAALLGAESRARWTPARDLELARGCRSSLSLSSSSPRPDTPHGGARGRGGGGGRGGGSPSDDDGEEGGGGNGCSPPETSAQPAACAAPPLDLLGEGPLPASSRPGPSPMPHKAAGSQRIRFDEALEQHR
jgi:hypothetical protein